MNFFDFFDDPKSPKWSKFWRILAEKQHLLKFFLKIFFRYFSERKHPESLGFIAPLAEKLSSPPVFGPRIVTASLTAPRDLF